MEYTLLYTSLSLLLLTLALNYILQRTRRRNYPPSPPSLPIIGHLYLLKKPLHRTLHSLSEKYGPIVSLQLGSRHVLVVSSPSAAEECFTKNDIVFANRPDFLMGKYTGYDYTTIVASPYGEHWRNLRRLSALEIFSSGRLNALAGIRREEINLLLTKLSRGSHGDFAKVELKSSLNELSFNITMRMIAGKRYYGDNVADVEEARQFKDNIRELFKMGGASNAVDFLPILRWVGYQGFEKRVIGLRNRLDLLFQGIIDEHRVSRKNTMIDHLLSLKESEPEYYTDEIIKGLMMALILAGTDTSAITIEWAMSLLLNHPHVLKKAKAEIDNHLGQQRLIDEADVPKLPYLQNIISETLRLFPPGPLMVPHMSSADCTVGGFFVPRRSILLVNAWAIHRDPKFWEDPASFKPERFEGLDVEHYKLMPFGVGRRSCPGSGLAQRVVGLTLGSMIQCFEWERMSEKEVDLAEGGGLTMPKAEPLEALCKARDIMNLVLSEMVKNI